MNPKINYRNCIVFILCIFTLLINVSGTAAQKIHVIVAADVKAKNIGVIAAIDQRNIEHLFRSNVPAHQLAITKIEPDDMRAEGIFKIIDGLEPSNEDTLVFYYSGHGAYDKQKQQQFLLLEQGDLYRNELIERLQKKSARLSVIVTDCCNIPVSKSVLIPNAAPLPPFSVPKMMPPLFESLFIYCKGTVDVTSSKVGEYSFCDNRKEGNRGSCFTYPLIDLFNANKDNAQIDWNHFLTSLTPKVNDAFKSSFPNGYEGQMVQTPLVFDYPGKQQTSSVTSTTPQSENKYRLGTRAKANPGGGMIMLEIVSGAPAYLSGLEAGDVILEINGKQVNTEKEYSDAVDSSGKEMQIKFTNVRTQKIETRTITLGW
ncbi:MAG: caspase family protein [Planctomycetaceae bacterium]|jgi:hypothetical protein|nr:caspase family protein [Planctomycetaceae bacterium]